MTSTNILTEEENTRKLELIFQNFLRAEKDWAKENHSLISGNVIMENAELSAQ